VERVALHEDRLPHVVAALAQLGDDLLCEIQLLRKAAAAVPVAQIPQVVVLLTRAAL